jgi:hypothetical protein
MAISISFGGTIFLSQSREKALLLYCRERNREFGSERLGNSLSIHKFYHAGNQPRASLIHDQALGDARFLLRTLLAPWAVCDATTQASALCHIRRLIENDLRLGHILTKLLSSNLSRKYSQICDAFYQKTVSNSVAFPPFTESPLVAEKWFKRRRCTLSALNRDAATIPVRQRKREEHDRLSDP